MTYEIDLTKYELIKKDFTLLEFLSGFGGLISIFLAITQVIHLFESPHYFVTSAMMAQEQALKIKQEKEEEGLRKQ